MPGKDRLPKILHVSTPRSWRGGEQQVAYLASEMHENEWPSEVLCRENSPLHHFCLKHQIPNIPFKTRGLNNYILGIKILNLCRRNKYDIIHAHDPHAHAAAIFAGTMGSGVPVIISRRVDFPVKNSWFSQRKYNHPSIKAIVCISNAILKITEPSIRNKELLRVIHSGIDPTKFDTNIAQGKLRSEYNIPSDHLLAGNVSAIAEHKDYPVFLKAAKILLQQNQKIHFLIIGDGPLRSQTEALISSLDIKENVTITGFRKDIPEVLPQLDIMMFTSKAEGLGTTVLDAFAAGVPVVATAAGGIPEMIEHEKTGMLSKPGDPSGVAQNALRLMSDSALRQRIISEAREKLKGFSCKATAEKNMNLYLEVFKKEKLKLKDEKA